MWTISGTPLTVTVCALAMFIVTQVSMATSDHSIDVCDTNRDSCLGLIQTRIVLIGKTGVGKSTTGNTILGKYAFPALTSAISQTAKTTHKQEIRFGRLIRVVDTPGLFDTRTSNKMVISEVAKSIYMTAPGPHAIILVISIGERFTEEDEKTLRAFQLVFGEEMMSHTFILFTRKENLDRDGITIDEYVLDRIPEKLQKILKQCDYRYIAFGIDPSETDTQVQNLLTAIDNMHGYYSSSMLTEADKILKEEEKRKRISREKVLEENHISGWLTLAAAAFVVKTVASILMVFL